MNSVSITALRCSHYALSGDVRSAKFNLTGVYDQHPITLAFIITSDWHAVDAFCESITLSAVRHILTKRYMLSSCRYSDSPQRTERRYNEMLHKFSLLSNW